MSQQKQIIMKTFKNKNFVKRDYECTNVVFCQSKSNPNESNWEECDESDINCEQLYIIENVRYFGYL